MGQDGDSLIAFHDSHWPPDSEVAPLAPQFARARGSQQIDKRLAAAIENGYLQVIDFQPNIIDAKTVEGTQQMFGGGNENTVAHQACRIADALDVFPARGDGEKIEICTAEYNSGSRGSWHH